MNSVEAQVNSIIIKLTQRGERAVKGVSDVMQSNGDAIRDLARAYAPVDEGNLEKAIVKNTTYTGVNRRSEIEIGVDTSRAGSGGSGSWDLATYANAMHEQQAIGSTVDLRYHFQLGEKSKEKDGGRGVVGGKYLFRAYLERQVKIKEQTYNAVKRAFK
jgi:hypothetical protein